jgi:hypothetical protein
LGLPTEEQALIRYLANSYKGVGQKTAETLVRELGVGIYAVMQEDPDRIRSIIPSSRAEKLLSGWRADFERRREKLAEREEPDTSGPGRGAEESTRRTPRGHRSRG